MPATEKSISRRWRDRTLGTAITTAQANGTRPGGSHRPRSPAHLGPSGHGPAKTDRKFRLRRLSLEDMWQRGQPPLHRRDAANHSIGRGFPRPTPVHGSATSSSAGWRRPPLFACQVAQRAGGRRGLGQEETLRFHRARPAAVGAGAVEPPTGPRMNYRTSMGKKPSKFWPKKMMVRFCWKKRLHIINKALIARDIGGGPSPPNENRRTRCSATASAEGWRDR